jgi:hypothetical protein
LQLLAVAKVLQASVRVLEERLGGPASQRARLQERLLLLLVLVDQLGVDFMNQFRT